MKAGQTARGALLKPHRLFRAWTPVLVMMGAIVLLSSIEGGRVVLPPAFPHQDKVLHLIVYGCLGLLLMRALWHSSPNFERPATLWVVFFLVTGFGSFDEYYQGGVPYRSPDVWDLLMDCVGGLLGGVAMFLGLALRFRPSTRSHPRLGPGTQAELPLGNESMDSASQ